MNAKLKAQAACWVCVVSFIVCTSQAPGAEDAPVTHEQFQLLQQQNELFRQQLLKQQELIDSLTHKVSEIQNVDAKRDQQLSELKAEQKPGAYETADAAAPVHLGKLDITGEGGVAFFRSEDQGAARHPAFRIDEARVFLEAPIWQEVYFFSELDLATREFTSLNLTVGELYLDFENVSQLWGQDNLLNLRVGRFYTPFGEEYQDRFAIDNPLISHSLSDIWGADDGVELYGKAGRVQYVLAVQNGGGMTSQALQSDKAVIGRVGYDPAKWLHLSVSGMRTGDLSVQNGTSAIWFGNGWFRSIGSASTTTFHANLVEGDVRMKLPWQTVLRAAGGYVDYSDDDPLGHNHRDVYYYFVEGVKNITKNFYGAARFSQIFSPNGLFIVGGGDLATYFGTELTTDDWRLSLALGYHFSPNLLVKAEYTLEQGHELDGDKRTHENILGMEAAFKF